MAYESPEAVAKVALLSYLRSGGALRSNATISELVVENWARRADVVTVGSELTCYEVKSKADRLTRLEDQLDAYMMVFDRVYAVVASRHMNTVMSRVPESVGLKELIHGSRGLEVRQVRDALPSPFVTAEASLNMLPVSELVKLIRAHVGGPCSGQSRAALMGIAISLPLFGVRKHLRRYLQAKHSSSSSAFNAAVAGRRIRVGDLAHLSIWQRPDTLRAHQGDPTAEWLSSLSKDGAFGPVPDDVRALLTMS
jgi:hypothetical protein